MRASLKIIPAYSHERALHPRRVMALETRVSLFSGTEFCPSDPNSHVLGAQRRRSLVRNVTSPRPDTAVARFSTENRVSLQHDARDARELVCLTSVDACVYTLTPRDRANVDELTSHLSTGVCRLCGPALLQSVVNVVPDTRCG